MICYGFLVIFACAASDPAPTAVPYCQVAQPVLWAGTDTRATKEQADRENRKYKRLCMTPGAKG